MVSLVQMAVRENRHVYFDRSLQEQIDAVAAFADSIGKRDNFERALARVAYPQFFGQTARTLLYSDFAPYSFGFSVQVQDKDGAWRFAMNGGLIFHQSEGEWGVHT